jgi:hypothetical protein
MEGIFESSFHVSVTCIPVYVPIMVNTLRNTHETDISETLTLSGHLELRKLQQQQLNDCLLQLLVQFLCGLLSNAY